MKRIYKVDCLYVKVTDSVYCTDADELAKTLFFEGATNHYYCTSILVSVGREKTSVAVTGKVKAKPNKNTFTGDYAMLNARQVA